MNRNQLKERANLYRKYFYEGLQMGHGLKVLMHLDACGEFGFNFLQIYTVKIFQT